MAHAHDASENNPTKEIIHALSGVVLLLVIIGGIAVFAWLRPAGNHESATVSATPAGRALDELIQQENNPTDAQKVEAVAVATAPDATADTAEQEAVEQVANSAGDSQTPVQDKVAEDKPVASDMAISDAPHDTTAENKVADNTATAEVEQKAEATAN